MFMAEAHGDHGMFLVIALTHEDLDTLRNPQHTVQSPPPPAYPRVMLFAAETQEAAVAILQEGSTEFDPGILGDA